MVPQEDDRLLRQAGEDGLLRTFRHMAARYLSPEVLFGPGDDAAVLRSRPGRVLLFTCDMMVEQVHFRREWATPYQVGWKAMAAALSDLGAMGGQPAFAVSSLAAPGHLPREVAEGIAEGLNACASHHGACLVGGDLVGSPGPVVVDVAAVGWAEEGHVLSRNGARPGDLVVVTGALGASGTGLAALRAALQRDDEMVAEAIAAHLSPTPRIREGQAIARSGLAHAMMDLSDGLAADLPRLCAESKVGATLRADQIPIHPACRAVASRLGLDPLVLAVSGGEDYELLLTCGPEALEPLRRVVHEAGGPPLTVIGQVAEGEGVVLLDGHGRPQPLPSGFDHFAPAG